MAQEPLPMPTLHRGTVQRAPFEIPSHLLTQIRAPLALTLTRFDDPAVGSCNTADGVSLREALVNCSATMQPVVYMPAGTYTLTSSIVTSNVSITLIGQDPLTTFIQGSPTNIRYFDIGLGTGNVVTFANLTLRNSTSGSSGNALRVVGDGHANLDNMRVMTNINSVRGTVRFDVETSSTLSANITNSLFSGNVASNGAGLAFTNELGSGTGFLNISDSVFTGNSAATGAGVSIASTGGFTAATIDNTTLNGNILSGVGAGGAISHVSNTGNSLTITDSTISENSAAAGSAIAFNVTDGALTIQGTDIVDNGPESNGESGALYAISAQSVVIANSLFDGNDLPGLTGSGGAMKFDTNVSHVTITDTTVSNNSAEAVGGIYAFLVDSFTADGLYVTGNTASVEVGGALLAVSGFASLTNSSFSANSAGETTGGLYISRATLRNVQIEDNTAPIAPDCKFEVLSGTVTSLGGLSITDMTDCTGAFVSHPTDLLGNLLSNGGFEVAGTSSSRPAGWTFTNITGDKRVCNGLSPYGKCALQFKGGAGEAATLTQNVNLTGLVFSPGEILTLYAMGDGSSVNSQVKVMVKAKYIGQPANKASVTFSGNHPGLTAQQQILTLTSGSVKKLVVSIVHSGSSGKFVLDRVFLTRAP